MRNSDSKKIMNDKRIKKETEIKKEKRKKKEGMRSDICMEIQQTGIL